MSSMSEIAAPSSVTDVLGRTRTVAHTWPDGSWECPFCGYGFDPKRGLCKGTAAGYRTACGDGNHCQNPACFANPHYPVERAREELAAAERRKTEDETRKRNREAAMRRATQDKQARDQRASEIRVEAERQGACVRCALKDAPYRVKYIKHRVRCPLEPRR